MQRMPHFHRCLWHTYTRKASVELLRRETSFILRVIHFSSLKTTVRSYKVCGFQSKRMIRTDEVHLKHSEQIMAVLRLKTVL